MLKRSLLTLTATLLATSAFAQTAPKPDGVWRGSIGLNAAVARGNSESTNIGVNTDAVRQTKVDKLGFYLQDIFANSKDSSTGKSSVTAQILRAGGRYDRDLTDRYQKQTAPGKKKNDVILFTGLQYAWGPK